MAAAVITVHLSGHKINNDNNKNNNNDDNNNNNNNNNDDNNPILQRVTSLRFCYLTSSNIVGCAVLAA